MTIDDKVYQYTLNFCSEVGADVDPIALRNGIANHLASARTVVTEESLEKLGHQHLALMINTAARYSLSLGEVMAEALRSGTQPVSVICNTLKAQKESCRRISKKPHLRVIKN